MKGLVLTSSNNKVFCAGISALFHLNNEYFEVIYCIVVAVLIDTLTDNISILYDFWYIRIGLDIKEMHKPEENRLRQFWSVLQDVWIRFYGTRSY